MKIGNKKFYTRAQQDISNVCRALGHPARVSIIQNIAKETKCLESKIVLIDAIQPSTVLNHLKALHKAGLVKGSMSNMKDLCYCVNWEKLKEFKSLFDTLYDEILQHQVQVTEHEGKCINK